MKFSLTVKRPQGFFGAVSYLALAGRPFWPITSAMGSTMIRRVR